MLALVQTSRLVRAHFALESAFRKFLLEQLLKFRSPRRIAASAGMSRRADVSADEDMALKLGHGNIVQESGQ